MAQRIVIRTTRSYANIVDPIGSQTLQTKVILKAIGDRLIKLQATINEKE